MNEVEELSKFEGLTFEEAKRILKGRKGLPINSFCGPYRSFPSHDVESIRESYSKLIKIKPKNWQKIMTCLKERALRFGISFSESSECKDEKKLIEWYLRKKAKKQKECGD